MFAPCMFFAALLLVGPLPKHQPTSVNSGPAQVYGTSAYGTSVYGDVLYVWRRALRRHQVAGGGMVWPIFDSLPSRWMDGWSCVPYGSTQTANGAIKA